MQCETVLLDQLAQITADVFASMLQLEITRHEPDPITDYDLAVLIRIQGAWNGSLLLRCSSSQAVEWASRLLRMGKETIDQESIEDALGEIVNMIGGNWKALLPPRNVLSVPTVLSRVCVTELAAEALNSQLSFRDDQGCFLVALFGQSATLDGDSFANCQEQVYV